MSDKNTVVAVVAGLVVKEDLVYLTKKAVTPYSPDISPDIVGKWEAPGGKWEESLGETLEEALVREIREELGWSVRVVRLLNVSVNTYANKIPYLVVFYQCARLGRVSDGEGVEGVWFPFDRLPANILLGVRETVDIIVRNKE